MSIYGAMRTSVSGMNVQSTRLGTIADNLANVGTTAYKAAGVEFSTLVLRAQGNNYESGAVETVVRNGISRQGAFSYTGSAADLAINGNGFFVVQDGAGKVALTRAGSFLPSDEGILVNAAGYELLGYGIGSSGGVVNGAAGLEPVDIRSLSLSAAPSSTGRIQANLPSQSDVVAAAALPSANAATAQAGAQTSLVAYDNLGAEVMLDFTFARTGANTWEVAVFDRAGAAPGGGFPYSGGPIGVANLEFDGATGLLTAASAQSLAVAVPNGGTVDVDLGSMTQFASDFSIIEAGVDGNAAVPVANYEISDNGVLTAVYDNGKRVDTHVIPLARVASPDNLAVLSGNIYLPSADSGDLQVGLAGESGYGVMVSGALEQSTVDIASELTAMIEAQRNYTANSRVFQTGADMMEVIVNLRS